MPLQSGTRRSRRATGRPTTRITPKSKLPSVPDPCRGDASPWKEPRRIVRERTWGRGCDLLRFIWKWSIWEGRNPPSLDARGAITPSVSESYLNTLLTEIQFQIRGQIRISTGGFERIPKFTSRASGTENLARIEPPESAGFVTRSVNRLDFGRVQNAVLLSSCVSNSKYILPRH